VRQAMKRQEGGEGGGRRKRERTVVATVRARSLLLLLLLLAVTIGRLLGVRVSLVALLGELSRKAGRGVSRPVSASTGTMTRERDGGQDLEDRR